MLPSSLCVGATGAVGSRRRHDHNLVRVAKVAKPALAICSVLSATILILVSVSTPGGTSFGANWWGVMLVWLGVTIPLAYALCRKQLPLCMLELGLLWVAIGLLCIDWYEAAVPGSARQWPAMVIVLDLLLFVDARPAVRQAVVSAVCVWLMLMCAEDRFRLGLFDLSGWVDPPHHERVEITACATPPCALKTVDVTYKLTLMLSVFIIDYILTQRFARGHITERRRVEASITAAFQISQHLAGFDLESAGQALNDTECLPDGLSSSLRQLLRNLASYRPFLPQSCLVAQTSESVVESPAPAGEVAGAPAMMMRGSIDSFVHPGLFSPRANTLSSGRGSHTGDAAESVRSYARHEVAHKKIALLAVNRRGFLDVLTQAPIPHIDAFIAREVESFNDVVMRQKGITEMASADHLIGSFGASRVCCLKSSAALACSATLQEPQSDGLLPVMQRSAAVCTGKALCGDFGGAHVRRFMVLGRVSTLLLQLERFAAMSGVGTLVDGTVKSDTENDWAFCLHSFGVFPKGRGDRPCPLWHPEQRLEQLESSQTEWMYQFRKPESQEWNKYNDVMWKWAKGMKSEALASLQQYLAEAGPPVRSALHGLERRMQGTDTPLFHVADIGISDSAFLDDSVREQQLSEATPPDVASSHPSLLLLD